MRFRLGHATHADWRMATELCLAQVEGLARQPGHESRANLGFVYFTEALASHASDIFELLRQRTGVNDWTGTVGIGVAASGAEYMNEPALVILLGWFAPGSFQVFSGRTRPPARSARTAAGAWAAHAALVHADPHTPDLTDLIEDMAGKVQSGALFGGLSSSRSTMVQLANGCLSGGLSGVVFSSEVALATRVSQACHPLGPVHTVTRGEDNLIATLDDRPALDVLLEDCQPAALVRAAPARPSREALVRLVRNTLCGFLPDGPSGQPVRWGEAEVRHLIGVDPQKRVLAVAEHVAPGSRLQFCTRDGQAARLDLVRAASELRDVCEDHDGGLAAIRGAIYVSCVGRGGALFGRESAELEIIRNHLGDIPLAGFFANGEIAGQRLYGYTGVLTLFL